MAGTMNHISTNDELASLVSTGRQTLAGSYKRLAIEMAQFGEARLESIYSLLAEDAKQPDASSTTAVNKSPENGGSSYAPLPASIGIPDVASLSTPYAIWAFAVSNEIRLFEELAAANISIGNSDLQSKLAVEARTCLDRAANYRVERRLAFHAERLSDKIASFPDIRRIDSQEDFAHVALAIEHYFQGLLSNYDGPPEHIGDVSKETCKIISYLEPVAQDAHVSNRLKRPLQRLARVSTGQISKSSNTAWGSAKTAIEADRIFDYYDQVFESAQDPDVLTASQHLSMIALTRLRILRRLRGKARTSGQV